MGSIGSRSTVSGSRARTRHRLVVAQVALSLVLLVGAGLLTRNIGRLLQNDPGFGPESTLTFRISLDRTQYPGGDEVRQGIAEIRRQLSGVRGVNAVGLVSTLPLSGVINQVGWNFTEATPAPGDSSTVIVDNFGVTDGLIEASGFRLVAGRDLTPDEPYEVLIDKLLADRLYPDGDAVGRLAHQAADSSRIVGVVEHVRVHSIHEDGRPQLIYPLARFPHRSTFVVARTSLPPLEVVASMRAALDGVDPTIPMSDIRTLDDVVDASVGRERLNLRLVGSFAVAALLITALGLYGVISGVVTQRRSEIGIRVAIGARRDTVATMILRQALRLVIVGVALGLIGAWAVTRLMEGVLVGLESFDPVTYLFGAVVMIAIGAVSAWLPSRRAASIPPVEALRAE